MSIKEKLKDKIEEEKKRRKEKEAFIKIVAKRALQERRKAYEQESLKRARVQGAQLANKPSFGENVHSFVKNISVASSQPRPQVRVRRRVVRRTPTRRALVRRTTKKRKPIYKKIKRKARRKTTKRKPKVKQERVDPIAATQSWGF